MNIKKMIAAVAVLALAFAAFAFVPTAEDDAADSDTIYLEGDVTAQITSTEEQKIVIEKNVTLKQAADQPVPIIQSNGELVIKEGATVTIEAGTFYIQGDSIIDGNIVSKVDGGLQIFPATEDDVVNINGSVTAFGNASTTDVNSVIVSTDITNKNVVVYGDFIIGTNAIANLSGVYFEKNSTLTVLGTAAGTIYEAGQVTIDGAASGFTIYLAEASAVVDITSVEGTVTITDNMMFAYAFGGVQYYIGTAAPYAPEAPLSAEALSYDADEETFGVVAINQMTIANVENIKITETIATAIAYDEDVSANKMYAETKMIVAPLDTAKAVAGITDDAVIATSTGKTIYFQTMTIDDVAVTLDGDIITIEGDVTYPLQEEDAMVFTIADDCTLEVTGTLAILKKEKDYNIIEDSGSIIAAHYTVKDADNNYDHYYTTLKKAITNNATTIDMMGKLVIDENITVPAGTELTADETINGTAVEIKKGYILDIANGAKFETAGDVEVYGTLIFENVNYGITYGTIYADVELKDEAYVEYTNVYNAFSKAKSGDELNAYNPKDAKIILDEDLTLPAGVKFDNSNDDDTPMTIYVEDGVTFIIAGTLLLDSDDSIEAESGFYTKLTEVVSGAVEDRSVIQIGDKGIIECVATSSGIYGDRDVSAAYFEKKVDGAVHYFITNIAYAFEGILDAENYKVWIAGENTIENLKVTGTEKERAIVIIEKASETTFKGFTFAYAQVQILADDDKTKITGDIGTATGKIIFNDAIVADDATFDEVFINDAMNFQASGVFMSNKATEISGEVYLKNFDYTTNPGADDYSLLTFKEKRFTVPAGAKAYATGTQDSPVQFSDVELIVAGDFVVLPFAEFNAELVSVTGTFTAMKDNSNDSETTIQYLLVGGTSDKFDHATANSSEGVATVAGTGKVIVDSLDVLVVFSGASVAADVLVDFMDDAYKTEFNVDGSLWMTVYIADYTDSTIYIAYDANDEEGIIENTYNGTPALENMKFNAWQTYDEKTKTYKNVEADDDTGVVVGTPGYEKVYADLSKNIYKIYVLADEGIDNVSIDGKLMVKGTYHYAEVAAGSHTLSYTLANGYSGNAVITAIDGATVVGSALTFTVNDDNYKADGASSLTYYGDESDGKVITLSGIQKSGIDTDPETHPATSTGLTVTEILLIVVVIIMAIMAVVLILRLNRS